MTFLLAVSCADNEKKDFGDDGSCHIKTIELIQDNHFSYGFDIIGPHHPGVNFGKREIVGKINLLDEKPIWELCQWHSHYSIHTATVQLIKKGAVKVENETKSITIAPRDPEMGDLILAIDSRQEYQMTPRKEGQLWPHLLVEQVVHSPRIFTLKEIWLHIEAKLLYQERWEPEGYTPTLHCAQIPYVLTIGNINPESKGYGDFLWLIVPVYDDRYRMSPPFISQDLADPSAKLIYNPGSSAYMEHSLYDKEWVTIDVDVLPHILNGLKTAWEKGYLKDSRDLSDYGITSTNFGWEITGLNRVAIQIRNLSLKVSLQNAHSNCWNK